MMQHFILFPILMLITMPALAVTEAADSPWTVAANPYRIGLKLERPIAGPAVIALDPKRIIETVAAVAVDQINQETFAFEKAVLVNPHTGKTVGRFRLVHTGNPIEIDGSFMRLQGGETSWSGFVPVWDQVALGDCSPRAPTDPYVPALEHTVPRIMGSLRV